MTKFTKITAVALFTMFLTACDQPNHKAENAKSEQTTSQSASSVAQGAEELKKLNEWYQSPENSFTQIHAELQKALATQNKEQIETILNAFQQQIKDVLARLDALTIQNTEVAALKVKVKETLVLSSEIITDSSKELMSHSPELQAKIDEKTQKLIKLGEETQKFQAELQTKFGNK